MAILIDSVPMEARRLIAKVVVNGNNESIPQVDVYLRAWPLAIDAYDWARKAVWTCSNPVDAPVIVYGL